MRTYLGIGLFSAATLLFQVTLTRLFSIAQFYHFAFLVVSLALLGFGASGSVLVVWPRLRAPAFRPAWALSFAPATAVAYLVVNQWAFDSYAIAWDREQVWRLLTNLLCLAVPFTCAGALVGAFLTDSSLATERVYGANMIGSALGAALAPLLIAYLSETYLVIVCCVSSALAAILLTRPGTVGARLIRTLSVIVLLAGTVAFVFPPHAFEIIPSPYKALSVFRNNPDAVVEPPQTNAYARLDIVRSPTIHSAPALSVTYMAALPPEIGLLIDGDNLLPVLQAETAPPALAASLPTAIPLSLYPGPDVLVLGVGGGLEAWAALQGGASSVVGVEPNGLIANALAGELRAWSGLVDDPRFTLVHQEIRTYVQQTARRFDLVDLALNDSYRPVTSGAFTLTENYVYTVEAFRAYLEVLNEDGMLVLTRWLQSPPSEELRTLGLILAALDATGPEAAQRIAAFRGFQTVTFLVKASPLTPEDVAGILVGAQRLKYDMLLAPNLPLETVNRYARLPEPVYYDALNALLNASDRAAFYAHYDFNVQPTTDDRPFFFHFFKWRQTPEILNNLGRTWQPFGGSGYFVLVALLFFSVLGALLFVMAPMALAPRFRAALSATSGAQTRRVIVYFSSLGLAYLFVEIATLQQFVLILGQPTLAIATVLGTLLLFTGIGSMVSNHMPWRTVLGALVLLLFGWPGLVHTLAPGLLDLPLSVRWPLSVLVLALPGFFMGVPFARGLATLNDTPDLVPWAWAINGSASVVSAILAALLALSYGFTFVLWLGGALYAAAWLSRPISRRV